METAIKLTPLVILILVLLSFNSRSFDNLLTLVGNTVVIVGLGWHLSAFLSYNYLIRSRPKVSSRGKAVLITGCDTGFGRLAALTLNRAGFHVFAGCLFPTGNDAQSLLKSAPLPDNIEIVGLDVTKELDINQAFHHVTQTLDSKHLTLWAVVNNAGILRMGELEWSTFDHHFSSIVNVNTFGMVNVTRKFLPLIRTSRGRIVNVNSAASRIAVAGFGSYCMSKHASLAFTDALRREMAKFGVRVSSIEPVLYATPMSSDHSSRSLTDQSWELTPEHIRNDYGTQYFKRFRKLLGQSGMITLSNVQQVPDAILDSIVSPEPRYRYALGNWTWRMAVIYAGMVPLEWVECFFRLFTVAIKRNKPLPNKVDN